MLEDLGLGLDDALFGPEALEMDGAHGRDDGDVGRDPRAQVGDLTAPVGPHLGDEHVGALGQVLVDGARQSRPVVEARGARHHRPGAAEQVGDVALGARLAVRAGDGDDRGPNLVQPRRGARHVPAGEEPFGGDRERTGQVDQGGDGERGGGRGERALTPERPPHERGGFERRPHGGQGAQAPGPRQGRGATPQREAHGAERHDDGRGERTGRESRGQHHTRRRHDQRGDVGRRRGPPAQGEARHGVDGVVLALRHAQPTQSTEHDAERAPADHEPVQDVARGAHGADHAGRRAAARSIAARNGAGAVHGMR